MLFDWMACATEVCFDSHVIKTLPGFCRSNRNFAHILYLLYLSAAAARLLRFSDYCLIHYLSLIIFASDIMVVCVKPLTRTPLSYRNLFILRTGRNSTNFAKQISTTSIMQPKISEGNDENTVLAETEILLQNGWTLDKEEMGIKKRYHFKTYTKALDFLGVIGVRSKSKNHHSTMTIQTGFVDVHWTTHHPRGLSNKDTFMARYCDEQARLIGTVDESEAQKCRPSSSLHI